MSQKFDWPIHTSSPARDLRWKAVTLLTPMFPRPHNAITAMGRGMRRMRLEKELAEYDLLHRLRRGRPASFNELLHAGMVLIHSSRGDFPTARLPLDEEMLVNPTSFDLLAGRVEDRLKSVGHR